MVNVNKERKLMEAKIIIIGNNNLSVGYAKLGLPNKYLQGGSVRRRITEVRNKINNYSTQKETVDEVPQDQEESQKINGKKLTEEELEDMSFKQLKVLGNSLGTTGRGKQELIDEILEIQNE